MKKGLIIGIVVVLCIAIYFIVFQNEEFKEDSTIINTSNNANNSAVVICDDSDGGIDLYKRGTTKGINYEGDTVIETDFCTNPVGAKFENCSGGYGCMIQEYHCFPLLGNSSNLIVDWNGYGCDKGCINGACLS